MHDDLGLNESQLKVASALVGAVKARGLPKRAAIIVIETGIVESTLRILANPSVPESMDIPHEGEGTDHDSVGPLQQRVPMWGTAEDCMHPVRSANKFLDHLVELGWHSMTTGEAAQAVQVSAFPDRYQEQERLAAQIVDAMWNQSTEDDDMRAIVFAFDNSTWVTDPWYRSRTELVNDDAVTEWKEEMKQLGVTVIGGHINPSQAKKIPVSKG